MTDKQILQKFGKTAGEMVEAIENQGLNWEDAITLLGLTIKVIATKAALTDSGNCFATALKRFSEGFEQKVEFKMAMPSSTKVH